MKHNYSLLFICLFFFGNCNQDKVPHERSSESTYYTSKDFKSIHKIDAHVHIRTEDSAFASFSKENNFRVITLSTDEAPGIEVQNEFAIQQLQAFPEVVFYATTFSVIGWDHENWGEKTIAYLKKSFSIGAVAVKLYKNIGMELKDKDGNFIMISDLKFDPIIDFMAKESMPLIGHFGEPKNCWLAIDEMTINGDKGYYKRHPEFHMYLHPQYPSYEDQLTARNEMLDKHPHLKFIGAHLGSLEWSLDSLAGYLDRFPEAVVDMAARVSHIQLHAKRNWQKTHAFFVKYQDRLLYGTDLIIDERMETSEMKTKVLDKWIADWAFFSSDEEMFSTSFEGGFKGLKLPKQIIDKLYRTNAETLFF